jgi:hypothetical protein
MNIQNEAKLRAKITLFYNVKEKNNIALTQKEQEIKQELALLVGNS